MSKSYLVSRMNELTIMPSIYLLYVELCMVEINGVQSRIPVTTQNIRFYHGENGIILFCWRLKLLKSWCLVMMWCKFSVNWLKIKYPQLQGLVRAAWIWCLWQNLLQSEVIAWRQVCSLCEPSRTYQLSVHESPSPCYGRTFFVYSISHCPTRILLDWTITSTWKVSKFDSGK